MKRVNGLFLVVVVAVAMAVFLAGCGDGDSVVYYQSESDAPGKLEITGVNTQKITLSQNADGSLKGIDVGSIKVYPGNVDSIFYESFRMGRIKGEFTGGNIATINGLPNNDSGYYYVQLTGGNIHRLLLEDFQISTFQPMFYRANEGGHLEYGNRRYESMRLSLDENGWTATITAQFGCDKLFGLWEAVEYDAGLRVAFVEGWNGTVHYSEFQKDWEGNIHFTLSGIPLYTPGRLYVIKLKGEMVEFEFNYKKEGYAWQAYTSDFTVDVWQSYDFYTDSISILFNQR